MVIKRKGHKSKKQIRHRFITEHQLILRHLDKYNHLLGIGYTKEQALKTLKRDSSMGSLPKLQHRVESALGKYGVTGISLDGIRLTDDVRDYIARLVQEGTIYPYLKGQQTLKLTKPKVWGV